MTLSALALVLATQASGQPQDTLPPSPIAELRVEPANPVMQAHDTLRLRAWALDVDGDPVPGAEIRFGPAGGFFEGEVEPDGLVRSGSTGVIPVGVVATVAGTAPVSKRVEVKMVPGPAARVSVSREAARLAPGQRLLLGATAYSRAGHERDDRPRWSSSAPGVAEVTADGLLTARAPGRATVSAVAGEARATIEVEVVGELVGSVEITPSSPSARSGDVVRFRAVPRDTDGSEISGLTPSWSFSPGKGIITPDGAFVGYQSGDYLVTASFGEASAATPVTVTHRDVRRPLTVLGRLPRKAFTTEEVWVHPSGDYAYLGTGRGGDRMYAIDIRDLSNPVVSDSLVADTRRVNDVMTTPDGRYLVHTREGASSRRNGIVIARLDDPAHPEKIAEFTEGVTAGVHSAFVYRQPDGRTHVYATNNGTGALHVIDITDPYRPREAATWRTPRPDAGRTLHDVDVQDGLAYLSYWNDGLVILDVGNGVKGGSPENPRFVSQYKYDLNQLYRGVEATAGPGFIRGTHTAWRYQDYVFIADEVFPAGPVRGAKDAAAGRAYGNLQVIDVSDLENPRSVAWYQPEFGGVHNVWVEDDKLYLGAYNAGFRVFDVSGELLGDLSAQGREIAHLNTADMDGFVQNSAMTWGVVVHDGTAFVNDMHNGLWIVRLEPESLLAER